MDTRPPLDPDISVKDFQEFYWLKEELIAFCRKEQLPTSGSKLTLAKRIEHYLHTGEIATKSAASAARSQSKFDWNSAPLSLSTPITDNYKNTEHVRQFFEGELGPSFKFNVKFMNWIKANQGKQLADAIAAWQAIKTAAKAEKGPKEIAPQFEYNRYIRDFLADNPASDRATAIKCWKVKKSMRGDNRYRKADLGLIAEK